MYLAFLTVLGCRPPVAVVPSSAHLSYEVAVVLVSGDRTVTSVYELQVEAAGDGVLVFSTLDTEGTWEEPGQALYFDSRAPKASDPWPLTVQHAIASVPAAVELGEGGSPLRLVDADGWAEAGRSAVTALGLPGQAMTTAEALLDPDGYLRDLRRNFPGTPPDEGTWQRAERIVGVDSLRSESCISVRVGPSTTWQCEGRIDGEIEGRAKLHDTTSATTIVADRHGVERMESHFEGFVVLPTADGRAITRGVGGRRLVQRTGSPGNKPTE